MAKQPEKSGDKPKRRQRLGYNLNVWIDRDLGESLDKSAEKNHRTKTAELTVILEEYFKRKR